MKKDVAGPVRLLITLVILLALFIPVAPVTAQNQVDLVISPAAQNVGLGDTFSVNLQAQCGTQTTDGMEIYLDFDPACLEVQSATATSLFPIVYKPVTFSNTAGTIDFSAGKMNSPFPSGTFNILSMVFLAKEITSSPSNISFHTAGDRVTLVDMFGENVTGTLSGGAYTIYDKTPPSVTAVSPSSGQAGVAVNSPVVLSFNKKMDQAATQGAFSLTPSLTGSFSWNGSGNEMTFTPAPSLNFSTTYVIGLSAAAKDVYNISPASSFNSNFTTQKGLISLTVRPISPILAKGRTIQFTATPNYSDGTHAPMPAIVWSSSDASKVAINAAGLATAVDVTTSLVIITASSGSIQGVTPVNVTPAELTEIILTPIDTILPKGRTQQLTATGRYTDTTTGNITGSVAWSSSDETRVFVNSSGLATAAGITISPVTITAGSGEIHGTAAMSVTPAELTWITITPARLTLARGRTQKFTAAGTYSDNTTSDLSASAAWSSSDINKVIIDNKGLATAVEVTDSQVTIAAASGGYSGMALVNVIPAANLAILPSTGNLNTGDAFTVIVQAQCGVQPAGGIDVHLDFDPACLAVQSATAGTALSQVSISPQWNNNTGTFVFSAANSLADPPSGNFTAVSLVFLAKSSIVTTGNISFHTLEPRVTRIYCGDIDITGTLTGAAVQIIPIADVTFKMTLQGGSRPENGWAVPVTIKIFTPGISAPADVLNAIPIFSWNLTTTKSGILAAANIPEVSPGTYDISVVSPHCLTNVKRGVTISAPETTVNLGTLLEGNANDDNQINIQDFGLLALAFNKLTGSAGYDSRADFDRNGIINISDFGLLSANYGRESPQTILVP